MKDELGSDELEEILRFGAKEIFEKNEDTFTYTDAMIDELLDRENRLAPEPSTILQEGSTTDTTKDKIKDFFSAFNVAKVWTERDLLKAAEEVR